MRTGQFETVSEIRLSLNEMWFLLEQYSPTTIAGIENPYMGWLAEEVEPVQREALRSLVDRDQVRMIADDEIALEESVAALVGVCAHADHSLIVKWRHGENELQTYAHFGNDLIVEVAEVEPGVYNLTACENATASSQSLAGALRSHSSTSSEGDSFQLSEGLLDSARLLCQEGKTDEAKSILKVGTKLKGEEISRLVKVLSAPVASSSFILIANRNNPDAQYVSGFAVLEGQDEMWLMQVHEQNGKPIVTFNPANANMVLEHFLEIMPVGYRER